MAFSQHPMLIGKILNIFFYISEMALLSILKLVVPLAELHLKVAFFSESSIHFLNLQNKNIPKNYPELEI